MWLSWLGSVSAKDVVKANFLSQRFSPQLACADVAASNSTKFVLLAVLIALVLFFASVATKSTGPRV